MAECSKNLIGEVVMSGAGCGVLQTKKRETFWEVGMQEVVAVKNPHHVS